MAITIHHSIISYIDAIMAFFKRTNRMIEDSESHLRYVRQQERNEADDIYGF